MTLANLLLFSSIYGLAVAVPGPGIAALIARVLRQGRHGLAAMIAGFVVGDLIWFTCAAAGLTLVVQKFSWLFTVIHYGGAAYLAYLGWALWHAPATGAEPARSGADAGALPLFAGTVSLTLGNPKVIIFFLSIMPLALDMTQIGLQQFILLAAVLALVLTSVTLLYAFTADRARTLFRSARALTFMHRGVAMVLLAVSASLALR